MGISRRHALQSVPVFAFAGSPVRSRERVTAQDAATPAGTPIADDPEALRDRLLEAPVQTPLFPADTGQIRPAPWIDEGDTDLAGTVGGVLMQTGQDENRNFIGPGVYIVFTDESTAQARLDLQLTAADEEVDTEVTSIEIVGYRGLTISSPDGTVTILAVGPVIVSALGDPALRSVVNCAALLDHLLSVMS